MKRHIVVSIAGLALAFAPAVPVFAQDGRGQGHEGREIAKKEMHDNRTGSSTPEKKERDNKRTVPGVVVSVGSDNFTMTARGVRSGQGTTTVNVVVTPTTVYKFAGKGMMKPDLQRGSGTPMTSSTTPSTPSASTTPASFALITVGAKVEVFGKVSTSTNTITAEKIVVSGMGMKEKMGEKRDMISSSTPQGEETRKPKMMEKMRDFFEGRGQGEEGAAGNSGIMGSLSHMFFGWLR